MPRAEPPATEATPLLGGAAGASDYAAMDESVETGAGAASSEGGASAAEPEPEPEPEPAETGRSEPGVEAEKEFSAWDEQRPEAPGGQLSAAWAGCVEGLVEGARNNVRCVIGLLASELLILAWWAFFPEKVCAVGNGTLPCDWGETDPCAPVDRDTCDKMTPTDQCFP